MVQKWRVPVYVRKIFCARMSIIGQSQIVMPFLTNTLNPRKHGNNLLSYKNILRDKYENEGYADYESFNITIPLFITVTLRNNFSWLT